MNRAVRRGFLPVLIALVAVTLAALPAWAAPPTWDSQPEDISLPTGLSDMKPQVAMGPDGSATAVWTRSEAAPFQLYVESSTRSGGGDWSAPVRISPVGYQAKDPQVSVAADGTATAVWINNGPPRIVQSASRTPDGVWSEPVSVSDFDNPLAPQLAVDAAGTATAVWTATYPSSFVRASTRSAGEAWSYPAVLSSDGATADEPDVATDASGYATAVWVESRPSDQEIVASRKRSGGSWGPVRDVSSLQAATA